MSIDTTGPENLKLSREDAWQLVCEWTQSDSLRRHMLAVEAAMRGYAPQFGGNVELWGLTGLLHDLDYERFPDMDDADTGHPRTAIAELRRRGYPEELIRAVASHADYMGVSRESEMEKALYAVDELSGFLLGHRLRAAGWTQRHDTQVGQEEDEGLRLCRRDQP